VSIFFSITNSGNPGDFCMLVDPPTPTPGFNPFQPKSTQGDPSQADGSQPSPNYLLCNIAVDCLGKNVRQKVAKRNRTQDHQADGLEYPQHGTIFMASIFKEHTAFTDDGMAYSNWFLITNQLRKRTGQGMVS
jgi:hypothetical protein